MASIWGAAFGQAWAAAWGLLGQPPAPPVLPPSEVVVGAPYRGVFDASSIAGISLAPGQKIHSACNHPAIAELGLIRHVSRIRQQRFMRTAEGSRLVSEVEPTALVSTIYPGGNIPS